MKVKYIVVNKASNDILCCTDIKQVSSFIGYNAAYVGRLLNSTSYYTIIGDYLVFKDIDILKSNKSPYLYKH